MSTTSTTSTPTAALPFTFGGFTIPAGCRRVFITAELEPPHTGSHIQPTGFPDLGPVLYNDPSGKHGIICIIDSEAKMTNWLEDVCLDNKHEGTWRPELAGLPYIKLTDDGTPGGKFITASTIDGHRFASEYVMSAHLPESAPEHAIAIRALSAKNGKPPAKVETKRGSGAKPEFVAFVRQTLGMESEDKCPAANVPRIHQIAMEYDPMALLHGFQISVKKKLTFVGLRSPRAITASIVGMNCERVNIPGVRFDPIGTASAAQAIFQKQRITAKTIEARFCIDVGLLASLRLGVDETQSTQRFALLLKIALCKIAWLLAEMDSGLRLRTECDLRLVSNKTKFWINRIEGDGTPFDFKTLASQSRDQIGVADPALSFDLGHSPLVLKYVLPKAKDDDGSGEQDVAGEGEEPNAGDDDQT